MPHTAVTLEDLLADFHETAARWKAFFEAHPAAANVPTDIARSTTVAELIWHIYGVAYRHSERLLGQPVTDLDAANPARNLVSAWKLYEAASENLARFLAETDDAALDRVFSFSTRTAGEISGSYRKLCLHVFVHTIRHWAQIGPLVRQHGYLPAFGQDIFFSHSIR
ncbi:MULTISPECIES: DinB family protein [Acidobacterium]|uniref:DinB family protein n=1 Tax=Acidobacterium capsulatum (strain ATCC 51196 / DSM 11244 / BCRC 80197 / JCM 7670 / NBRC 15755 / NCIMB 13165 / 161) TaxID=240015 RepID=C1F8W6_ACIC5|nr:MULTISPECIES: DinB family protein [Acidobacterium]ACO32731.1 DinB family protein [Acidobacterium capsulatum ATCC 51196]HCT59890.1 hypothetical protein [Acidobacterium sp.]